MTRGCLGLLPLPPLALSRVHGVRRRGTRLLLAVAGVGEREWRYGHRRVFTKVVSHVQSQVDFP